MDEKDKAMWVHTLWDPIEKIDQSPLHSKKDGIKVAAYCRVSLDSLNLSESLESQVSYYTHYINNRKNWKFVGIYFDNLVSGRKASLRQGFTRMLRHCDEGKIDLILVKNVSRFSRNAKELIEIVERLKEINVTVYFETENIESTRSDTTYLLNTFASIAQAEIEEISYNVKWGYEKRTLEGKADIRDMYGYDKAEVDGETIIKINEEEAQIVREIFAMYLNGYSSYKIAGELSRRNIKTKQGKKLWRSSTIAGILSNISYTGDILVRKTIQDMLTNKIRSAKGIEDQYFIENHHPAIITKEVFEQVQEKIKKNGKPISPPTRRYNPLLKRVHCGNCGCKFNRNKNRGKDYFKCISKMTNKSLCVSPVIKEDDIIKIMLGGFKERFDIENPKIIRLLQRLLIKINQNDHFEFHRLKALNQIQLAKSLRGVEYTDEDIEQMEESYKEFEKELVKIEDDRKFRLEAIKWLDTVENFEAFENQATIEYMRGWIKEITIYSLNDYKIHWIDGKNTEIGSCISIKPELEEPLVDENLIKLQIKGSFEENKITLEKGGDIQNKEGVMMQAAKRLKPEEPKSDLMFLNIKKQISNSVVMQTTVPIPSKKKLKVAAYIRVSTESDQQEISLKTQYTYFLYYILRDPQYILADIYIDDGKSGLTTKGRTEFNRLIDDCVAGKVNLIITKSLSRFARNTLDTLEYLNLLKNLDPPVNVWFQKENLYSLDEKSDLLIKLLSVIGQEESLNMGESIAWAKRSLAKRGIVNPGRLTYGYYYGENKEWLINKEEEKVVRRIYKEYQEGKEILKIAEGLESESIPSPSGQKKLGIKKN